MDRRKLLGFGAEEIVATLLRPEHDVALAGRWIVLNLGCEAVLIENDPPQPLLPREGTLVNSVRFQGVGPVLALRDIEEGSLSELPKKWRRYSETIENPSPLVQATDLYISPQLSLGGVEMGIPEIIEGSLQHLPRRCEIRINLWYAPGGTDCMTHNRHDFMEFHLQVAGVGRMQKFRSPGQELPFQEMWMAPGQAHSFFGASRDSDANGLRYAWHRYLSSTDCVWLAVEYHPVT